MPEPTGDMAAQPRNPDGDAYDWFHRAHDLLATGDAAAAATLLARARLAEPESSAVLEALARAEFDAGRMVAAERAFRELTDLAPDSDYAHFGLGSSLARLGRFRDAEQHLAVAEVMSPHRAEYRSSLRQVRATLTARTQATPEGDR